MLNKDFSSAVKICWDILLRSSFNVKLLFFSACMLDLITVALSVAAPAVLKMLIDSSSTEKAVADVSWLGAAYGITWLSAELLLRLRGALATIVVEKLKFEATKRLCLNSVFNLDLKVKDTPSGIFATKLSQTNVALPMFVDGLVWQIIPLLVRLVFSISLLFQFVSAIYSVLLAVTVVAFIVISFFSYKGVGEKQKMSNMSAQSAYWKILDALKNKPIIIAHAEEKAEFERIEEALLASTRSAIGVVNFSQIVSSLQVIALGIGLTAITLLSARDLSGGAISIGDFVQINAYVLQFVFPISYVGMVLSAIKRTSVTIAEISQLLRMPCFLPDVPEKIRALAPPAITLDKVSVKSLDGEMLLKNISFYIKSGSSLAVVGNSGAGKTTLVKAILGLIEVSGGLIKIDEQELCGNSVINFRKNVGYVPQEPFLFDRPVKDNIFGSASFGRLEIKRILEISGIYGDQGLLEFGFSNNLSGGEKQRISFARAVARYPSVIILDEPTSSLDQVTKKILSAAIYSDLCAATRIIITHDLEEARKAENILVMENGQIIEFGSHLSLLKADGWYAKHWSMLAMNPT